MEFDNMPEQQDEAKLNFVSIDDGKPKPEIESVTTSTDLPLVEVEILDPITGDGTGGLTVTESVDVLDASVSTAFHAMAMAGSREKPAVTKRFKGTESFMGSNHIMMERDVFDIIPTAALTLPNPNAYSLGLTYGEPKPKGKLFTGQNRKARRAAERQQMQKLKKVSKVKSK